MLISDFSYTVILAKNLIKRKVKFFKLTICLYLRILPLIRAKMRKNFDFRLHFKLYYIIA